MLQPSQSIVQRVQDDRFRFRPVYGASIKAIAAKLGSEQDIRRTGVGLLIGTTALVVAAFWLLLFVAPALFNAHTSTGLWLSILLLLLVPPGLARIFARVVRMLGYEQE